MYKIDTDDATVGKHCVMSVVHLPRSEIKLSGSNLM